MIRRTIGTALLVLVALFSLQAQAQVVCSFPVANGPAKIFVANTEVPENERTLPRATCGNDINGNPNPVSYSLTAPAGGTVNGLRVTHPTNADIIAGDVFGVTGNPNAEAAQAEYKLVATTSAGTDVVGARRTVELPFNVTVNAELSFAADAEAITGKLVAGLAYRTFSEARDYAIPLPLASGGKGRISYTLTDIPIGMAYHVDTRAADGQVSKHSIIGTPVSGGASHTLVFTASIAYGNVSSPLQGQHEITVVQIPISLFNGTIYAIRFPENSTTAAETINNVINTGGQNAYTVDVAFKEIGSPATAPRLPFDLTSSTSSITVTAAPKDAVAATATEAALPAVILNHEQQATWSQKMVATPMVQDLNPMREDLPTSEATLMVHVDDEPEPVVRKKDAQGVANTVGTAANPITKYEVLLPTDGSEKVVTFEARSFAQYLVDEDELDIQKLEFVDAVTGAGTPITSTNGDANCVATKTRLNEISITVTFKRNINGSDCTYTFRLDVESQDNMGPDVNTSNDSDHAGDFIHTYNVRSRINAPPQFISSHPLQNLALQAVNENETVTPTMLADGTTTLNLQISDANGDAMTCSTPVQSAITAACDAMGIVTLTVLPQNYEYLPGGSVSTTVTVADGYGGMAMVNVSVVINDVNDPVARALMVDPTDTLMARMIPVPVAVVGGSDRNGDMVREIQPGQSVTVDVDGLFTDEDTNPLWNVITHTAAAKTMDDEGKVSLSVANGVLTIAPLGAAKGLVTIVISATDGDATRPTSTAEFMVELTGKGASSDNTAPYFLNGVERVACSIYENRVPQQMEAHADLVGCQYPAADDDETGDILNYTFRATDGTNSNRFLVDPEGGLWLRGGAMGLGVDHEMADSHSGIVVVDDGYGGTDTLEITIHVLDMNEAPVIVAENPLLDLGATGAEGAVPFRVGRMATRDAKDSFMDPDEIDDPITYLVSQTPASNAVSYVQNGSEINITGTAPGTAMFAVRASGSADALELVACPEAEQTLQAAHNLTKICEVNVAAAQTNLQTDALTFTVVVDENQPIKPDPDAVTDILIPLNSTVTIDPNDYYVDSDGDDPVVLKSATSDDDDIVIAYINSAGELTLIAVAFGRANVTLDVTDEAGNVLDPVTLTVSVNSVPELSLSHSTLLMQLGGDAMIVVATFSDADAGQIVTISASSSNDAVASAAVVEGTTNQVRVTGVASGTATITVSASDNQTIPGIATATIAVTVNAPPSIRDIATIRLKSAGTSETLTVVATDSETAAEDLTISASSDNTAIATVTTDGNMLTVTAVGNGRANIHVTVTDEHMGTSTISFTVSINSPPRIVKRITDMVIGPNESTEVDLSDVFIDAEGATTVSEMGVSSSDESVVVAELLDDGATVLVSGRSLGTADVTVTAMDNTDLTVSDTFTVKVNAEPLIAMAIDDQVVNVGATLDVDVSGTFTDDNNDTLTITASSNFSNATVAIDGNTLTITGVSAGMADVTVTATETDTLSTASVSDSFNVRINTAPTVRAPIADVSVPEGSTKEISLDGVFADRDGTVSVTGATSDDMVTALVNVVESELVITAQAIGTANVTVNAMDNDGASVSDMFVVTVRSANAAPVVAATIGDQSTTRGDDALGIALGGVFEDPDGDVLMITAVSLDPTVGTATVIDDYVTLSLLGVGPGSVTVTVTAEDPAGLTAVDEFMLAVDTRPEAIGSLSPITLEIGGEGISQSIAGIFLDGDGDALTYDVSVSNQGIATVALTGMDLSAAPMSRGKTTVTVTATDAVGYSASVSGAIGVGDGELRKVAEQSLAGFARAMLSSVSTTVGPRLLSDVQNTDLSSFASSLVANQANRPGTVNRVGSGFDSYDSNMPSMFPTAASNNLWSGSATTADGSSGSGMMGSGIGSMSQSFSLSLNNKDGVGAWSVWGNADRQSFEATSYKGIASSIYLGVDVKSAERWLVGVAVASNSGETNYSYGTAEQTMNTSLTTVLPYFRYQPDTKSTIWGVAGIGSGDVDSMVVGADTALSDLSMNMYMVGGRRQISQLGRLDLALKGDFAMASLETDTGIGAVDGLAADISRIRGGIEGSFMTETGNGGSLTPFAEINLRQDGGDGDTGTGVEFSGGLRVDSATFSLEARGRILAMHSADDYGENGFSLMATLNPSADSTGISITVAPRWGGSALDSGVMWSEQGIFGAGPQHLNFNRETGRAVKTQIEYGYLVTNERYMLTPFVDLDMSAGDRRQVVVGARLKPMIESASNLSFDMTLGRVERRSSDESDAQIGVNATLRF